ncbi:MAG TPA: UDP-N-acetylmuramate--L-alanine ligase, partial [Candidatus Pacearchaeota archaeon]|nr:UDP-N-acetylmuramate--L-alanine ligase [Candidatus Pacearchaeota archaeon]HOK94306.1 UDP-N-acetylmuramate--L-alanine ligase [Candidatus Pacearchaeota archaeon]HPO75338.1 UDP-N-acetylmuramate--L-alanine ligase [Candidatus Pacearchaeota archaeon]
HFIGIGGIGVSALAQYYLATGNQVSGSDLVESEITKNLRKKGVNIYIGKHKAKNVPKDVDLVIYTPATPSNNPELKEAQRLKIKSSRTKKISFSSPACSQAEVRQLKILSYPEALGELTKQYFTIAVCGTHGKSTTTAMISLIFIKAGFNPTVIIGTKLKEFGNNNFRMGGYLNSKFQNRVLQQQNEMLKEFHSSRVSAKASPEEENEVLFALPNSKILIIEADEYAGSFLNYWPQIIVLTTIDKDHLDYYKNLTNILKAFKRFISHLPEGGYLVANQDDKNIQKLLISNFKFLIFKYSLSQKKDVKKLKEILKIPGEHNVSNALAALTCARILKIPDKITFKALSEYHGAWRRFEVFNAKLKTSKKPQAISYKLISDYGHHPTEIKATLKAAREKFPGKRIILIFQPHQYQRTKLLFKDFVKCFDEADLLILTEIYGVAGREKGKIVRSKELAEAIQKRWEKKSKTKKIMFIKNMKDIPKFLGKILQPNDVVIVMGAGNIYNLTLKLKSKS